MRNGCWVGCAEPPAGSSVTAVTWNARLGATFITVLRLPSGAVLKMPRLPGGSEAGRPHIGREQRGDERIPRCEAVLGAGERPPGHSVSGPLPPIRIARDQGEHHGRGRDDPGEDGAATGHGPDLARVPQDPVAHTWGGQSGGRRVREQLAHLAERLCLGAAHRALGQVCFELQALSRLEGAQRVGRGQRQPLMVGHDSALDRSGASEPRSFSIPARMRVFTVPNGSPSSVAISVWVRPSKYASSMTRRCGSGSSASARSTSRRASRRSTARSGGSPPAAIGTANPSVFSRDARLTARARRPRARQRSSARVRVIVVSQAATLPRAGSNWPAVRHACPNASATTSSASAPSPTITSASEYAAPPWRSYNSPRDSSSPEHMRSTSTRSGVAGRSLWLAITL